MQNIDFNREQLDLLVEKVKRYFDEELGQDIGGFEAEFLVQFLGKEVGAFYYNQGLSDAHALFTEKSDELSYLIQELEEPIR